jgi:N6-adenosine-specific RNA methylase IME4
MCDHEHGIAEAFLAHIGAKQYGTILADPPWQFANRTGKMAPEHKRLSRYSTLTLSEIRELPVPSVAACHSHLYLWVPNALLKEGLNVMETWGFQYKTNIIWHKIRKDGGPDGRGVGFYFRNTTEIVLFGTRGHLRTLAPGRRQVNIIKTMKREHSRKPDELYEIIEACSPGPYLELFARGERNGWSQWGDEVEDYHPSWPTYKNHSQQIVSVDAKSPAGKLCRRRATSCSTGDATLWQSTGTHGRPRSDG